LEGVWGVFGQGFLTIFSKFLIGFVE